MIKYVNLIGLFDRNHCDHEHCIHNIDWKCTNENYISDFMDYHSGDEHATCNGFEAEDGYCECGAKLIFHSEWHDYGDTVVEERMLICPNGC